MMHQIIKRPHSCWWSFSILWTNIVFVCILHAVHIFWLVLSTHLLHLKILMTMYRRQVEKPTCQPVAHWKSHDHSEISSSSREWYHLHGPRVKAQQLLFESHYRYRHQAHPSHHPGSVKEQPVDPHRPYECWYLGIVIPAATDIT